MQTLDEVSSQPQTPVPFMRRAVQFGLIWAGVGILISLIGYLTNTDPNMPDSNTTLKIVYGVISFGIAVAMISLAIITYRDKDNGGWLSFGRGVVIALVTALISGAITGVFSILYITVINPEYIEIVREATIAKIENDGGNDQAIEMATKMTDMMLNPVSMFFFSIMGSAIFGLIIGLVVSAIVKREPK